MKYTNLVKRMIKEATNDSIIGSFIRQLSKEFNLHRYGQNKLELERKSDIPKIQEYLQKNDWKQSKSKKDNWHKTINGQGYEIRVDSTFGFLVLSEI